MLRACLGKGHRGGRRGREQWGRRYQRHLLAPHQLQNGRGGETPTRIPQGQIEKDEFWTKRQIIAMNHENRHSVIVTVTEYTLSLPIHSFISTEYILFIDTKYNVIVAIFILSLMSLLI